MKTRYAINAMKDNLVNIWGPKLFIAQPSSIRNMDLPVEELKNWRKKYLQRALGQPGPCGYGILAACLIRGAATEVGHRSSCGGTDDPPKST